jgi:chromosome segregation ATPase
MCLIASLWENMNPPFRALDEWDVFLDAVNRKNISINLLEFGLTNLVTVNMCTLYGFIFLFLFQEYQFIFISPQGASDITCDPSERHRVSIMEIKKN